MGMGRDSPARDCSAGLDQPAGRVGHHPSLRSAQEMIKRSVDELGCFRSSPDVSKRMADETEK
jgi:hypothetical protein